MTNIDYDKMWKEIIELTKARTAILPGEKTLKMFMDDTGMSENVARVFLKRLVDDNKLNVRQIQDGKARVNVYSPNIEHQTK